MINMHARVWSSPRRSQSHISIRWFHLREEKMSLCKTVINLWRQRNVFLPTSVCESVSSSGGGGVELWCSNDEGCVHVCLCVRVKEKQVGGAMALCDAEIWGNYRNVRPIIGYSSASLHKSGVDLSRARYKNSLVEPRGAVRVGILACASACSQPTAPWLPELCFHPRLWRWRRLMHRGEKIKSTWGMLWCES